MSAPFGLAALFDAPGARLTGIARTLDAGVGVYELRWYLGHRSSKRAFESDPLRAGWLDERWAHVAGGRLRVSVGGAYGFGRWLAIEPDAGAGAAAWLEALLARIAALVPPEPDGEAALLVVSEDADRQLMLIRTGSVWRAWEAEGALALYREGSAALRAHFAASRAVTLRGFAERLAAAGVAWSEDAGAPDGMVRPHALLGELYVHYDELHTARLEKFRAPALIDAWLAEQLASLGGGSTLYLLPYGGSAVSSDSVWWRIDAARAAAWLPRLFRPEPPEYLLLLSLDGARALLLHDVPGTDYFFAAAHATAAVLAAGAERLRLDDVLATAYPFLRVPTEPLRAPLRPGRIFAGAPALMLPPDAVTARRDAWLRDALFKWRNFCGVDDASLRGLVGPYSVSLGGVEQAPRFAVYAQHAWEWLPATWDASGAERLVIVDGDQKTALGLERTGEGYRGFLHPLGDGG